MRVPPDQRDRQDAHRAPPPSPASIFGGKGVFTAWDNHAAIGLKADWVAIQLDDEGGGGESVASLKAAGYKYVFGWQARPSLEGVLDARNKHLDGYIGQAENEAEYEACLGLGKLAGLPHALVGNVGDWWDGPRVKALGWELILEAYDNEQPDLYKRLDSKGYRVASFLYGCYAVADVRVSLAEYRAMYPGPNWSVYLAETLSEADRVEYNR